MVKKLVVIGCAIVLMPVSSAFAQDPELVEMENELDMQAAEIMSRRGDRDSDKGEKIVRGVIDLIGTIADRNERGHGRGDWDRDDHGWGRGRDDRGPGWGRGRDGRGRHPGYGRQPKRLVCVAKNANGRAFQADGYILERVQRRALQSCQELSRPRVKRTCRVVSCHQAR